MAKIDSNISLSYPGLIKNCAWLSGAGKFSCRQADFIGHLPDRQALVENSHGLFDLTELWANSK